MNKIPMSSVVSKSVPLQSPSGWITEHDVAKLLNCSLSKLRQDRHKCKGLNYYKVSGKSVRYSLTEIQDYMENCKIIPLQ